MYGTDRENPCKDYKKKARKRVMREERKIEVRNLRSQRNQMIQTLEAELRQKDKHLHLMAEVAVVMSAVAGSRPGALFGIALGGGEDGKRN